MGDLARREPHPLVAREESRDLARAGREIVLDHDLTRGEIEARLDQALRDLLHATRAGRVTWRRQQHNYLCDLGRLSFRLFPWYSTRHEAGNYLLTVRDRGHTLGTEVFALLVPPRHVARPYQFVNGLVTDIHRALTPAALPAPALPAPALPALASPALSQLAAPARILDDGAHPEYGGKVPLAIETTVSRGGARWPTRRQRWWHRLWAWWSGSMR